ncbi:hypothetical protein X773_33085 [Mesorhizobium sp. LSJC285A00]|nr:hypothetical protein X773_33085 [Mesorhizobium sp. LSJC285A00]
MTGSTLFAMLILKYLKKRIEARDVLVMDRDPEPNYHRA